MKKDAVAGKGIAVNEGGEAACIKSRNPPAVATGDPLGVPAFRRSRLGH